MIAIRPARERGHAQYPWLNTYHSFSFGDYYDPEHMGFSSLRVINEDWIAPGKGFPTHGHQDMEIITCPLAGALEHRDSLGNGSVIRPGEVQRMTAGTGIRHSEYNPSETEPTHLLQIWLLPERIGLPPGYEQRRFDQHALDGRLRLVASRDGRAGSLTIHQDALLYVGQLGKDDTATHHPGQGRKCYVQVARGALTLNDIPIAGGDGAAVEDEETLQLAATETAEVLLFDLP